MRRFGLVIGFVVVLAILAGGALSAPPGQDIPFEVLIQNTRLDMQRLANDVFGGAFPNVWTGNADLSSQTVIADLWFDNEQLRGAVFGEGMVPPGWIGATSYNSVLVVRNVRHDLELSADEFYGFDQRPEGWLGGPPLYRCSRSTMNTVYALQIGYNTQLITPENIPDYCAAVARETSFDVLPLVLTEEEVDNMPALILAIRGDLERLADETQGLGERPDGWVGNVRLDSETLIADLAADLELLADEILGPGIRPDGWNGEIATYDPITYRNLRFDLELLADAAALPIVRPNGWQGQDPLLRCDEADQNVILLAVKDYEYVIDETLLESANFCSTAAYNANNLVENPPPDFVDAGEKEDTRYLGESQYAFAYLDPAALDYMGVMPAGIEFRAWYRGFGESNMMFVSGENFAVFIDRRWTTMEREVYVTLPTLEGVKPLTFCDAVWCDGPGPTPTPTGGGPLELIISGATPPATIDPGQVGGGNKQLVSWNHIRVNYLLHRPEVGVTQVTLEICQTVSQINCEPVTSVFNNALGTGVAVISQFNGLNVFELPYGYNTDLLIEGPTLFSVDIWLNDPTLLTPAAQGTP